LKKGKTPHLNKQILTILSGKSQINKKGVKTTPLRLEYIEMIYLFFYLFRASLTSPHVVGSLPLKLMLSPAVPGSYSSTVEQTSPGPRAPPIT
jgi:hypothetical protein